MTLPCSQRVALWLSKKRPFIHGAGSVDRGLLLQSKIYFPFTVSLVSEVCLNKKKNSTELCFHLPALRLTTSSDKGSNTVYCNHHSGNLNSNSLIIRDLITQSWPSRFFKSVLHIDPLLHVSWGSWTVKGAFSALKFYSITREEEEDVIGSLPWSPNKKFWAFLIHTVFPQRSEEFHCMFTFITPPWFRRQG